MIKKRLSIAVLLTCVCVLTFSGLFPAYTATFTKRLIGTQDISFATGGTGAVETFNATTADGYTITLNKIDATYLKFRTAIAGAARSVEDLVDGGYDVIIKALEVYTKWPEVDARAYGDTRNKTTIDAAIAAIGSLKKTLVIYPDRADTTTTWTLADDLTIPSNITLKVSPGALLDVATGKTLTINGPIIFDASKKFTWSGTGKVVFGTGTVPYLYPDWWGFSTSASAATNAAAMTTILSGFSGDQYPEILILPGSYSIDPITIDKLNVKIKTTAYRAAKLTYTGGGAAITVSATGFGLENIELALNDGQGIKFITTNADRCNVNRVHIGATGAVTTNSKGIYFDLGAIHALFPRFTEVRVTGTYYGVYFADATAAANAALWDHCHFDSVTYGIYDVNTARNDNMIISGCTFQDFTKTGIYTSSGKGWIIKGCRFELTAGGATWDAFNVPADDQTKNPVVIAGTAFNIVMEDCVYDLYTAGRIWGNSSSNNDRNEFKDTQLGIYRSNTYYPVADDKTAIDIRPYSATQTADLMTRRNTSGSVVGGVNNYGQGYDTKSTVTSAAGAVTLNCNTGYSFFYTQLSENVTAISFSNGTSGDQIEWLVYQPAAGAFTLPATAGWQGDNPVKLKGGAAAPFTLTAQRWILLKFRHDGTRWIHFSDFTEIY